MLKMYTINQITNDEGSSDTAGIPRQLHVLVALIGGVEMRIATYEIQYE